MTVFSFLTSPATRCNPSFNLQVVSCAGSAPFRFSLENRSTASMMIPRLHRIFQKLRGPPLSGLEGFCPSLTGTNHDRSFYPEFVPGRDPLGRLSLAPLAFSVTAETLMRHLLVPLPASLDVSLIILSSSPAVWCSFTGH